MIQPCVTVTKSEWGAESSNQKVKAMSTNLEPLLPCPLCGAQVSIGGGPLAQEQWQIYCGGCLLELSHSQRESLVGRWNTRPTRGDDLERTLDETHASRMEWKRRAESAEAKLAIARTALRACEAPCYCGGNNHPTGIHNEDCAVQLKRDALAKVGGKAGGE